MLILYAVCESGSKVSMATCYSSLQLDSLETASLILLLTYTMNSLFWGELDTECAPLFGSDCLYLQSELYVGTLYVSACAHLVCVPPLEDDYSNIAYPRLVIIRQGCFFVNFSSLSGLKLVISGPIYYSKSKIYLLTNFSPPSPLPPAPVYLATQGQNPKVHLVKRELVRVCVIPEHSICEVREWLSFTGESAASYAEG